MNSVCYYVYFFIIFCFLYSLPLLVIVLAVLLVAISGIKLQLLFLNIRPVMSRRGTHRPMTCPLLIPFELLIHSLKKELEPL